MTVGIAAICDDGNAIVMAADRRLTYENSAALYHDGEHPKIIRVSPQAAIAVTGGITESDLAMEKLSSAISLPDLTTVSQIADGLHRCCQHIRREHLSRSLTTRWVDLSFDDFTKQAMDKQSNSIISEVFAAIKGFNLNLAVLLAGIDNAGAHVYCSTDAIITTHRNPGFTAIGSGSMQALNAIARSGHVSTRSIGESLYWVYAAKRAAEFATGVGPQTDMLVIRSNEASWFVPQSAIETLHDVYDRLNQPALSKEDAAKVQELIPPLSASNSDLRRSRQQGKRRR